MKRRFLLAAVMMLFFGCTVMEPQSSTSNGSTSSQTSSQTQPSDRSVVAENLEIPWDIAFLPSGELLVTERPGILLRIGEDRKQYPIEGVHHRGEGGLLGIALHPDFERNKLLYLYLTTNDGSDVTNRIERYHFGNDELSDRTEILSNIPGSLYHDGGRMAFGPDGFLYITTGDAGNSERSQDTSSLAGKILRIGDDGSIPADNPFGNAIYSYGHRNPQGLTWDQEGRLWSTEHGRSGVLSGYDELNLIEKGKNYGWPVIQGSETREGMLAPILHSGASDTWAPASALFYEGSIFFGGLKGEALYEVAIDDSPLGSVPHLLHAYGRIRTVTLSPDGFFYLTTSNTDGRGDAAVTDDRIIRIDPKSLQ